MTYRAEVLWLNTLTLPTVDMYLYTLYLAFTRSCRVQGYVSGRTNTTIFQCKSVQSPTAVPEYVQHLIFFLFLPLFPAVRVAAPPLPPLPLPYCWYLRSTTIWGALASKGPRRIHPHFTPHPYIKTREKCASELPLTSCYLPLHFLFLHYFLILLIGFLLIYIFLLFPPSC